MKTDRHSFTLIELLVVIAIIAILAGMLLPAIAGARKHAKKVKAKTAMKALETAIAMYESDYGVLPVGPNSGMPDWIVVWDDTSDSNDKYDQLISILQGANPRGKRYLDVDSSLGSGVYVDPWGKSYEIALDTNYDGDVAYDTSLPAGSQPVDRPRYDKDGDGNLDPIFRKVAIWSQGDNSRDDKGEGDDITTWK